MSARGDGTWLAETLHGGVSFSFRADRVIHRDRSDAWDLVLFENETFGRVIMLDGATQVTEADEFVYHEMMAHVPILAHGNAREVLIVGGGDCGMAEEALKHVGVERLTQVEIDRGVVEFSREHLASINAPVFRDDRFDLVIDDGADFVARTERRFDVIMVDSTDPIGPGAVLFTPTFYANLRRCLRPGGIAVTQSGVPFLQRGELIGCVRDLRSAFPAVTAYVIAVPTYIGGHMALGFASEDGSRAHPDLAALRARFDEASIETRYYTPEVHAAAFALPRYIGSAVEEGLRPAI